MYTELSAMPARSARVRPAALQRDRTGCLATARDPCGTAVGCCTGAPGHANLGSSARPSKAPVRGYTAWIIGPFPLARVCVSEPPNLRAELKGAGRPARQACDEISGNRIDRFNSQDAPAVPSRRTYNSMIPTERRQACRRRQCASLPAEHPGYRLPTRRQTSRADPAEILAGGNP